MLYCLIELIYSEIYMNKKVLIVVAHTDDEAFGMGGTICKHVINGDLVYAIAMTDGVG